MPPGERYLNHPLPILIALTIILQVGNFVWDWRTLGFYDHVTFKTYGADVSDNAEYSGIAANLLSGKGYVAPFDIWSMREGVPTYFRSPGVPFMFTVPLFVFARDEGYRITDSNRTPIWATLYVFHLLIVCLGTVYFYKLCRSFVKNPTVSFVGALIYTIWPSNLIDLSPATALVAESLMPPLLLWIFYVLVTQKRNFYHLAAGVVLGCCLLTRTYLVFVPFLLFLFALLLRTRVPVRPLLIAGSIALVVLFPWPLRNYLVFGDFSLGSQGGWTLFMGSNPAARGSGDVNLWGGGRWDAERIRQYPVLTRLNEKYPGLLDGSVSYGEREVNKLLQRESIDWARANTSVLPWLLARKLAIEFYPASFEGRGISWVIALAFLGFVPGLLLYVARCWKGLERAEFLILTVPILCICMITVVFYAEYRQRFLMEPFMLLFALYAVQRGLVDKRRGRNEEGSRNADGLQTAS